MRKDNRNDIITYTIAHPTTDLDVLRKAFDIPQKYTDERVLEGLLGIIMDDYMNSKSIDASRLQDILTDGQISERWLSTKTRRDAIQELTNALVEHAPSIIRSGSKGLNSMSNEELETEYNSHFMSDIQVVE